MYSKQKYVKINKHVNKYTPSKINFKNVLYKYPTLTVTSAPYPHIPFP
jgi:hypothetical protein